jgi:enoyl-CoA hydratase/carnithine racemase
VSEFLDYAVSDGIGTITINRPEKKNAMTYAMLGDFIELVGAAGADPSARVLILTGVPGAFCAGTDLADLSTVPGAQRGLRGTSEDRHRWWPLVECPKPVICAVDGPAVGMGAEFTTQCDIRLAGPGARFAWNFAHRGLVPDTGAGSWLLPRILGHAKALKLLYTGAFLSAEEALALGYVEQVLDSEALLPAARELAAAIAAVSPFSTRRIKALVYEGMAGDFGGHMQRHTQAMAECFASADHAEGVAAFLERRAPTFTGS